MRLQNLSRLFVVAILVLSFPMMVIAAETVVPTDAFDAPSKLCTPKKPITCRAGEIATAPEVAEPVALSTSTDSRLESEQAALCWARPYLCRSGADLTTQEETTVDVPTTPATKPAVDSRIESQQAALCWARPYLCRSTMDITGDVL